MRYIFTASILAAAWGQAQVQVKGLQTVGTFSKYIPAELAKDVWGYTLPDGKEFALLSYTHGLGVLDVTDPGNIREVRFIAAPRTNWKTVKVYRHYAYLGTDGGGKGLQIIDLSGLPASVRELPAYTGNNFTSTHNIWIDTAKALLYATGPNGQQFRILSLQDPEKPAQLHSQSVESHDFMTHGRHMFLMTARTGTLRIMDVTDPRSPAVAAILPFPGGATLTHNAAVTADGRYLLSTEEAVNKSLKVWDIRDLKNITLVSQYLSGDPAKSIAHNVYLRGDTAYVSHYGQGLRVLDITDRARPKEIAYYHPQYPSQVHDALMHGAFGAYVHFRSGNILSSDATLGLFIHRLSGPPTAAPGAPQARRPSPRDGEGRLQRRSDGTFSAADRNLAGRHLGGRISAGRRGRNASRH